MRKSWLMVIVSTVVLGALGIGLARADVLADVKKKGVLVVGTKADYRPFGYLDPSGKIIGFEPDLAADVAKLAEFGDPVACDIMRRAGAEVAATLAAALDPGMPPLAAGTGGAFAAGGGFTAAFEQEFARLAPHAELVTAAGTPLDGAVQLARLVASGAVASGHPPFVWIR